MEINQIHNQFHKVLYGYIAARVNNSDDAADILQEVFIKIAAKLSTLSDSKKLKSWIFTITRNSIIDYYRKTALDQKIEITEKIINQSYIESDNDATQGLDKCLNGFIKNLPEEYRDIIIDSEIKGIKQKDLSDKYELAYPSVRSRVQRGRARLKEMLLNCCQVELDSRGNIMEVTNKKKCGEECGDCE
jgi:RNA polymerase sigma-70 factor (ECF subfamily)